MDLTKQNFSQILSNSLSSDATSRKSAEQALSSLANANFSDFLFKLSQELSEESKPTQSRQMAAIHLKNVITYHPTFQEAWKNLDKATKDQLKNHILATLASKVREVRTGASSVVAAMAKIEAPLTQNWPDLIQTLCTITGNEDAILRLSAIESLGFICEEMTNKTIDANSVDLILTALITTIKNHLQDVEIIKYILKALFNCIKLAEKNFSKNVNKNFNF